ncbi:MAG: ATP-binding cassette domain-containing protein, partial [Bacteroidetes bacterium]|nr:ATP-binding cassette domain-containing protein [Bacteroidota bacterium]
IGLVFRSVKKSGIEEIIKPVMEEFGIWDLRDRNINLLSAGEKKRVAIVRALVLNTKIILLDEVKKAATEDKPIRLILLNSKFSYEGRLLIRTISVE